MRKFHGQSTANIADVLLKYKSQIKLNSKEEMMNLFQIIMKYHVNIDGISVYINDTFESYVLMMVKLLSTHKVTVSVKLCFRPGFPKLFFKISPFKEFKKAIALNFVFCSSSATQEYLV